MELEHLSAALHCSEMFDYSIFVFILFSNLHNVNIMQYGIFTVKWGQKNEIYHTQAIDRQSLSRLNLFYKINNE